MYAADEDVRVGAYPDLWQKGRYRVELATQLSCEPDNVDKVLEQLGYEIIDADQWGRSYRHSQDHNKTIELDESDDPTAFLKLLLRYGDLDEVGIDQAEDQLRSLYAEICQLDRNSHDDSDYESLYCPTSLEADQYRSLDESEKLTYGCI